MSYVDMIGCVHFSKFLDANQETLDKYDKKDEDEDAEEKKRPNGGSSGGACDI